MWSSNSQSCWTDAADTAAGFFQSPRLAIVVLLLIISAPWYIIVIRYLLPESAFGLSSCLRLTVLVGFIVMLLHLASGLWTRQQLLLNLRNRFDSNADGGLSAMEVEKLLDHLNEQARKNGETSIRYPGDSECETKGEEAFNYGLLFKSFDSDHNNGLNSSEVGQFIDAVEDIPQFRRFV